MGLREVRLEDGAPTDGHPFDLPALRALPRQLQSLTSPVSGFPESMEAGGQVGWEAAGGRRSGAGARRVGAGSSPSRAGGDDLLGRDDAPPRRGGRRGRGDAHRSGPGPAPAPQRRSGGRRGRPQHSPIRARSASLNLTTTALTPDRTTAQPGPLRSPPRDQGAVDRLRDVRGLEQARPSAGWELRVVLKWWSTAARERQVSTARVDCRRIRWVGSGVSSVRGADSSIAMSTFCMISSPKTPKSCRTVVSGGKR